MLVLDLIFAEENETSVNQETLYIFYLGESVAREGDFVCNGHCRCFFLFCFFFLLRAFSFLFVKSLSRAVQSFFCESRDC